MASPVSCGGERALSVASVVSRGVRVGRLGVTGGAFVGCVGGLFVTGGSFVGGFRAQLRCFVVSVVSVVSCGAERALAVVPVVSCGRQSALSVVPVVSCGGERALSVVLVVSRGVCVGRSGETGGAFVGVIWAQLRCFALAVVPAVSCGRARALSVVPVVSFGGERASTVVPVVSRGVCVGRLGVTGGAFVGCVGGLGVTGGSFVGGFWAQLRCFALAVVSAVSCGRERALSVVPAVSCGGERALAVVSVVSSGAERASTVVPLVSIGSVDAAAVVPVVSRGVWTPRRWCRRYRCCLPGSGGCLSSEPVECSRSYVHVAARNHACLQPAVSGTSPGSCRRVCDVLLSIGSAERGLRPEPGRRPRR